MILLLSEAGLRYKDSPIVPGAQAERRGRTGKEPACRVALPVALFTAMHYLLCYRVVTSQCVFPGESVRKKKKKL
jgi:hypothetical protein